MTFAWLGHQVQLAFFIFFPFPQLFGKTYQWISSLAFRCPMDSLLSSLWLTVLLKGLILTLYPHFIPLTRLLYCSLTLFVNSMVFREASCLIAIPYSLVDFGTSYFVSPAPSYAWASLTTPRQTAKPKCSTGYSNSTFRLSFTINHHSGCRSSPSQSGVITPLSIRLLASPLLKPLMVKPLLQFPDT